MTEADRLTPTPFNRLEEIFYKMPQAEDAQPSMDRRVQTLKNDATLTITKTESSAQKSFGVVFQGVYFSMTEEGLRYVSLPDISIFMGDQTTKVDTRPFLEFKGDPVTGADTLVNWIEQSINTGWANGLPFRLFFAQ